MYITYAIKNDAKDIYILAKQKILKFASNDTTVNYQQRKVLIHTKEKMVNGN